MGERVKIQKKDLLFDNKALAALIFPLVIEQLLAVLVGMADSVMIARVGEAAVSGVSLVDTVMVLFINLFAALATGGAVIVGQYLGYKDERNAAKAANQLLQFILLASLAVTALIYLARPLILHGVFGAIDEDVAHHANIYLLIVTASVPFIALYNGGAAIFRIMGNSRVSMMVSIVMNIVNVCGNAILIYGFHRGAEGVAIPTLVSRMTAAVLILFLLARSKDVIRLEPVGGTFMMRSIITKKVFRRSAAEQSEGAIPRKKLQFDGRMIHKILRIGIPNGLENSMFQLGKILVLSLVSTFGTSAIAANAVSNAVAMFQNLPGMAIDLAITTVVARCVGAGAYDQARYYTKKILLIIYAATILTNGLIYLALPGILQIYNLTDQTAQTAWQMLCFHALNACIIWPMAFSLPCTLRAAGDARDPMIISVASMWICRIVFSYVLGKYMHMGVFGIWVAMVIDWYVRALFFILRYRRGKWTEIKAI